MSKVSCVVPASLNSTFPPAASITMSATESNVMSPELVDCTVTPVCPSTVVVLACESSKTAPLDVTIFTAPSPVEISSAALEAASSHATAAPAPPEV